MYLEECSVRDSDSGPWRGQKALQLHGITFYILAVLPDLSFLRCYHWSRVPGMYLYYLLQIHMNLSLPQKKNFKKVKSFFQYSTKTEANIYSKHLAENIQNVFHT